MPIDTGCIGEKANATRPEIEQIMIRNLRSVPEAEFERDLYVIRRRIEKQAIAGQVSELYICSLSCRSVIYKGMFLAEHLTEFYPDLLDARFVSRFAIYHQRYSTTPSRPGASRSRSASSRTTARSTPSPATPTG